MPARSKKPTRKAPTSDKIIAKKAHKAVGKITEQRFAATGQTTRIQGHVAAHGKRSQARRDAR